MISLSEKELKSNADEYLKWRSSKLGASEVPAIMGVSPYDTSYGLWLKKTGRAKSEWQSNPAIEIGNRFEASARSLFEMKVDLDFPPTIVVSEEYNFMHASLDGFNAEAKAVLEIKNVSGDKVFQDALNNKIAEHYYDQVQQQLYLSKADVAYFFVCKIDKEFDEPYIKHSVVVEQTPDIARQNLIIEKILWFWNLVQTDTPPPLSDKDIMDVQDSELIELCNNSRDFKSRDDFKKQLIEKVLEKNIHHNLRIGDWRLFKTKKSWTLKEQKG